MKKIIFSLVLMSGIGITNETFAQAQATAAKQTNTGSQQCSATGTGTGATKQQAAVNAENNMNTALQSAQSSGNSTYNSNTGNGGAICTPAKKTGSASAQ